MNESIRIKVKEQVAALPNSPGVYQFVDNNGVIIYVGKAKNLKKRVSSYFVDSNNHSSKIRVMVGKIVEIRHLLANSEQDALLLENSLIKELQPRYNSLLKDDKTYPWLVITNEPFPRVVTRRSIERDGAEYYGPYGTKSAMRAILDFIHALIPVRICTLDLAKRSDSTKYRPCLQYHLNKCMAPCIGKVSQEEYDEYIAQARLVLKGNLRPVREWLETEMFKASDELRFEDADIYKHRIIALQKYQSHSVIVSSKVVDCDIFTTIVDEDEAFCNFLRIRNGSMVAIQTIRMDLGIDCGPADVLSSAIQYVVDATGVGLAPLVLVEVMPTMAHLIDGIKFFVPFRGEKLDLIKFSKKNAENYRANYLIKKQQYSRENVTDTLMADMKAELKLDREPRYMECFDNSNTQGTYAVSSCVVFRNGRPSRDEYRHFRVKSVEGPDDFATMYEVVYRRYSRLVESGGELPDLIIVDGGKGQLSYACMAMHELGMLDRVNVIGLAERYEEVFYPGNPNPHYLNRLKQPLKTICHIRDEAHRFAINYHRLLRNAPLYDSELLCIRGIGEKTRAELLRKFKSVEVVKGATEREIAEVVGISKAKKIKEYFANKQGVSDAEQSVDKKNRTKILQERK